MCWATVAAGRKHGLGSAKAKARRDGGNPKPKEPTRWRTMGHEKGQSQGLFSEAVEHWSTGAFPKGFFQEGGKTQAREQQ